MLVVTSLWFSLPDEKLKTAHYNYTALAVTVKQFRVILRVKSWPMYFPLFNLLNLSAVQIRASQKKPNWEFQSGR